MAPDVYRMLQEHLDELPGGYPATESGVEIQILKKLFTPEQAELTLCTSLIPERANVIAYRAGISDEEAVEKLDQMVQEGLILGLYPPGKEPTYMSAQYVIGIWEYNVNELDQELVDLMSQYHEHLFDMESWKASPQLRTIPVSKSLDASHAVMPHEEAEKLIAQQSKILVAPCICRKEHQIKGDACDKPLEACLVFGGGAYLYEKRGVGRVIDQAEALDIIKKADEAGLVLQPSNSKKIINICTCCGCCCGVLKAMQRHPHPAELVTSPFIAQLDQDECIGCEECVERCQMDALSMADDVAVLDLGRCIGCGLCVSTCPSEALTMTRKPDEEQREVPGTVQEAALNLARARGKMSDEWLTEMMVKSKADRLAALEE